MKIRIRGNSVRFRLTKSEVEQLCTNGECRESTMFSQGLFTYSVQSREQEKILDAELAPYQITLFLSKEEAKNWGASEQVGYEVVKENTDLLLVLEKDFTCLDDRGEDESDNYPNPKMAPLNN